MTKLQLRLAILPRHDPVVPDILIILDFIINQHHLHLSRPKTLLIIRKILNFLMLGFDWTMLPLGLPTVRQGTLLLLQSPILILRRQSRGHLSTGSCVWIFENSWCELIILRIRQYFIRRGCLLDHWHVHAIYLLLSLGIGQLFLAVPILCVMLHHEVSNLLLWKDKLLIHGTNWSSDTSSRRW